jgi:MFS family permease
VTPSLDAKARLGLTLIAGGAVANIYYNQPLLGLIVAEFGDRAALWVPTTALVGYGLGIVGLVPLGDALPRRALIVGQCLGLALALLAVGLAPNLASLALAHLVVGILSCAAQQAVPFAAELAPDASRGRIVGQVMTGLLTGILLARTASGFLGAHLGWRPVFLVASVLALAMAGIARATLPHTVQTHPLRYRALMLSILHLARTQPVLRTASLSQALLFAAFNAFWATLALLVEGPPFGLSAAGAGLFGVIGVCGAFVAPLSGRFPDRRQPARGAVLRGALGRRDVVARRGGPRGAADRHRHKRRAHRQPDPGLRPGPRSPRADQHRAVHDPVRVRGARRLCRLAGLFAGRLAGRLRGGPRLLGAGRGGGGPRPAPAGCAVYLSTRDNRHHAAFPAGRPNRRRSGRSAKRRTAIPAPARRR